ncbi:hypothetical protein IGJ10_001273 [Enterococcus sp. AZ094]
MSDVSGDLVLSIIYGTPCTMMKIFPFCHELHQSMKTVFFLKTFLIILNERNRQHVASAKKEQMPQVR